MTATTDLFESPHARGGFTLFEVAISLVIMTVGVLSVLMLMPTGIKAQQVARFQILASAKAIELISVNANQWRKWDEQRLEGLTLGLCSINQIAQTPLAEQKACNWRHGSLPVPLEIARRLDSENDEIQRILNDGGYLFYSSPRPIASTGEGSPLLEDREIPNESQRLVYAFVGNAQQPALASHPCKAWPYYDWYPAPPRARATTNTSSPTSRHEDSWRLNAWPNLNEFLAVNTAWKAAQSPTATKTQILAYRDAAKALVTAVAAPGKMTVNMTTGIPDPPPGNAFTPVDAYRVLAAQYLAQAMVWLTSPTYVLPMPSAVELMQAQEEMVQAKDSHENAMKWLHRHVSTNPYDWGIDRALNFQNAWDHPLLQYELFDFPTTAGKIIANPFKTANGDVSWRVLSAQTVINAGTSSSYGVTGTRLKGNQTEIQASWGLQAPGIPDTFNLTNAFEPAHRCRQLVFWAVDWKSYVDAESAPSAPQDASRFPYDSVVGSAVYNGGAHKFHNPERYFTFDKDGVVAESMSDKGIYLGLYGADRNGNKRFDVGTVPTSVRMRASSVARFNFYNPRVWTGLRN
jgi:hypothetical protein